MRSPHCSLNARQLIVIGKVSEENAATSEFCDISSRSARNHATINYSILGAVSRKTMQFARCNFSQFEWKDVIFSQRIQSNSVNCKFLHALSLFVILYHSPISPPTSISLLSDLKAS
jgi:hypothetical protein